MREHAGLDEPEVDDLLARLDPVDLVLIEGFHLSPYPKCEIVTAGQDRRPSYLQDSSIVALVTDVAVDSSLPQFPLSATAELAAFILSAAGEVMSAQIDDNASAAAVTTIAHRHFAR
jgi:molybdopterin-guanine dinucleotide biosynthesis protein B